MSNWISVKEKLPSYIQQVLVYHSEKNVCEVAEYANGAWQVWNGDFFQSATLGFGKSVTHWMPLPDPPEEG